LTEKVQAEKINKIDAQIKNYESIKTQNSMIDEKIKSNISSCLKTFYNKSVKKLVNKKSLIEELTSTRENFKSKFNFHKQAEMNLLNILKVENELSDLNQCLEYYDNIKNSEFKSDMVKKIHKLISMKKEAIILNDINRVGKNDPSVIQKHMEDYKTNNWLFTNQTILKLKALIDS